MHAANCFHKLYCSTHHCINHFAYDIFGKLSCGPDLGDHQGHQPLHGLHQGQVLYLLAAGMKEAADGPLIRIQSLLEREEHIADHDHGRMVDWAVIIPQLRFLFQSKVVLEHL